MAHVRVPDGWKRNDSHACEGPAIVSPIRLSPDDCALDIRDAFGQRSLQPIHHTVTHPLNES
jgi:hypothetical protein